MFEQMLLPNGHAHQGRCAVFAFTGELSVLTIATLIMAYSDVVPVRLQQTVVPLVLSALPPPAAATRAPARTAASKFIPRTFVAPVLTAPQTTPKQIMVIADAEPSLQEVSGAGILGGVPGGVPGGSLNDLLGTLPLPAPVAIRTLPKPAATPPVPTAPTRVRVGGEVEAALLTHEVAPAYPPAAKRARIEGTVEFSATIALDGRVKDLRVVSGNPLLIEAARNAVKQWVYRPTYLNGQPVEVLTVIAVKFGLIHGLD